MEFFPKIVNDLHSLIILAKSFIWDVDRVKNTLLEAIIFQIILAECFWIKFDFTNEKERCN